MKTSFSHTFLRGLFTLFVLASMVVPALAAPGDIIRISVAPDGTQANGNSYNPSISADGRYVAFQSYAKNLVIGDTNERGDIFVYDRLTGQKKRISIASDGTQGNSDAYEPSISADGRYIAFYSAASNLVSGDTNGKWDIFVHDQVTGQTTRVSIASNGAQANYASLGPSISADGRYVAFYSNATNLVSGDTNNVLDIFVHDRVTGQTTRISVASNGAQGNSSSFNPSISADGRYVAFSSLASNLVNGDMNGARDIFVHDRVTGQTIRVSVASDGTQANGDSYTPSISADGRYIAFVSEANNLVSGDTNQAKDIFVHDRVTGQTIRVSVASNGVEANADSSMPAISITGRYVAFRSNASNLVSNDNNNWGDIFVHDIQTHQTVRVSVRADGTEGNSDSYSPSISGDGRFVVFDSYYNFVNEDTDYYSDIFLRENTGSDSTNPNVIAITRSGINPTAAGNVKFTIIFSELVTGVDSGDFTLNTSGDISGAAITNVDGSGMIYTVTVNTGTGTGTIRLNLIDNDSIVDGAGHPLGGPGAGNGDFNGEEYTIVPPNKTYIFRSLAAQDGFVTESGESTDSGGALNSLGGTLRIGDDAQRRQVRSILSFATYSIPDNAVITKVTLKVKLQKIVGGGDPISDFGGILVDVRKGTFGAAALEKADFQASANATLGPFMPTLDSGWYVFDLSPALDQINILSTNGKVTQIRLRFAIDDNDDTVANYLNLFSGNATLTANRPQLIVECYVP